MSKNMVLICFVSQEVEQDAKHRIKKIIPSGSYEFFKSGPQYNYFTRSNFKSQYLKTTLGTFFEDLSYSLVSYGERA